MEADWEIEIDGEAPIIDAYWQGFVDLRSQPERVRELSEVRQLAALSNVLVRLNANGSSLWTAKCDVWSVDESDPFELDAPEDGALHTLACYVDLLPRSDEQWAEPEAAVEFCRRACARLRASSVRCCRVDLIVRGAMLLQGKRQLGITAYLAGCGTTEASAVAQLESALVAFADSVLFEAPPAAGRSKLQ